MLLFGFSPAVTTAIYNSRLKFVFINVLGRTVYLRQLSGNKVKIISIYDKEQSGIKKYTFVLNKTKFQKSIQILFLS